MSLTYLGALVGLVISILWITLGFGWTVLIAVMTVCGAVSGHYLTKVGLTSPRKIAIRILNHISN